MVKLLETLLEWLVSLPLEKIPYDAILDLVNNKMRVRKFPFENEKASHPKNIDSNVIIIVLF